MLKKSISVKASAQAVHDAIVSYRTSEPSKRKIISSSDDQVVIEEKFSGVPVIGGSRVVYAEHDRAPGRIDYQLVESDKVSKFQGYWLIEEKDAGKTNVELAVELDSKLPIPFKENILHAQADADMKKRLDYVKRKAERS